MVGYTRWKQEGRVANGIGESTRWQWLFGRDIEHFGQFRLRFSCLLWLWINDVQEMGQLWLWGYCKRWIIPDSHVGPNIFLTFDSIMSNCCYLQSTTDNFILMGIDGNIWLTFTNILCVLDVELTRKRAQIFKLIYKDAYTEHGLTVIKQDLYKRIVGIIMPDRELIQSPEDIAAPFATKVKPLLASGTLDSVSGGDLKKLFGVCNIWLTFD